jgi:predicted nucleotidyltransferase
MSSSLTAVLFPEYRRRVLGLLLLNPGRRYHVREIARLTATTPGTLTRELAKLAEAGLLLRNKVGSQVQYAANEGAPIFEELSSILRKTSGLVDILAKALEPIADRVQVAFVFGSQASGKAVSGSDVDIMLIGDDLAFGEVVALLYPAQEALGREINPKLYPRAEWQQLALSDSSFYRDIMAKPKLFVIGGIHELG